MKNWMISSTLLNTTCLLLIIFLIPSTINAAEHDRKMYIIYMGSHLPSGLSPELFYAKMMTDVLGSVYTKDPSEYLLHTYQRSFYGCVAMLTNVEAQQIAGVEGVVSVFPDGKMELQTTRSWDFMGFTMDVERSPIEKDVIIGVFDTGIWPESTSFNDEGLSAIPIKWKGICQTATNFTCNKKIIGARFYKANNVFSDNDGPSPRDVQGHGTHTASIVAGVLVPKASFSGLGSGTARGGVPAARIAVYKVCWEGEACRFVDILSAFDDAIADGVDIISMSVGGSYALDYDFDTIAIGSFHAMQRGILASLSAGNSGPSRETVSNVAPWLMSVAASTIDRKFLTDVRLGNGQVFQGALSLNPFDLREKNFPLIYGADAPNSTFPSGARICASLNQTLVEGKIVVCERGGVGGGSPIQAGAAGVVLLYNTSEIPDGSLAFPLPFSVLSSLDADDVVSYATNRSRCNNPEGIILRSDGVRDKSAPNVASFSSRGPNLITPTILKPDLSAPGVNILAAFSPEGNVSSVPGDTRSTTYHIASGTSMACPHASATAAYVKSFHPDWSPAAIRSALMTTAFPLNSSINTDAELAYGAGHINPKRAIDPGLVYNATEVDYINFLCGQGFSPTQIALISSNNNTACPNDLTGFVGDLNYPSITVATNSTSFDKTFLRRVTSVTEGSKYPNVYNVSVTSTSQLSVKVDPETLNFTHPGHELSYTVQVKGELTSLGEVISASVEWFDGVHKVRSPIVAFQLDQ